MSELLTIALRPPRKESKPSYKFSHQPSREWVAAFTDHLAELEYWHRRNKVRIKWFVMPLNLTLIESNSRYIWPHDFGDTKFHIKSIINRIMELECKWNDLLELHPLILKAVELANIDVPDSVYTPAIGGSSSRLDIYNYLTKNQTAYDSNFAE